MDHLKPNCSLLSKFYFVWRNCLVMLKSPKKKGGGENKKGKDDVQCFFFLPHHLLSSSTPSGAQCVGAHAWVLHSNGSGDLHNASWSSSLQSAPDSRDVRLDNSPVRNVCKNGPPNNANMQTRHHKTRYQQERMRVAEPEKCQPKSLRSIWLLVKFIFCWCRMSNVPFGEAGG